MGKIHSGILSGVSGTVGPVVGAIVRGVATLRSKPKKSTKPAKESQIQQRTKFGIATKFIKSIKRMVDIGFQAYNKTMSPANAAVQELLANAITGVSPNYTIDFPKVVFSKGGLYDALTLRVMPPLPDLELRFTWNPAELPSEEALQYADDRIAFVLYDEVTGRFITLLGAAARSAGTYQLSVPFVFEGATLHVWAFFVNPEGTDVSNSQYLGTVTPIM